MNKKYHQLWYALYIHGNIDLTFLKYIFIILISLIFTWNALSLDAMVRNVRVVRREYPPRKWCAGPRITCTTWSVSPAWCAAVNWTPATNSTWWRTGSSSVRLTTNRPRPGGSMVRHSKKRPDSRAEADPRLCIIRFHNIFIGKQAKELTSPIMSLM